MHFFVFHEQKRGEEKKTTKSLQLALKPETLTVV